MSHFLKNLTAEAFNDKFPVGSRFKYFNVLGIPDSVEVTTRSPAWALGSGHVVVSLTGRAGGFHINHLQYLGEPLKEVARLTAFDVEMVKGLCVKTMSHYPLTDEEIIGRAECPMCQGEGYLDANGFVPSKRQVAIEVFGMAADTAVLDEWLKTITPELVLRLANQVSLGAGAQK